MELGSGRFIPGFEEQVEGMNIGEEKDITVKFPDDYGAENLKGKNAVFHIKLHEIKAKELPEINDEFIKDAAGAESVEAYKADTKKKLQESNAKRAKAETEDKIIKAIAEKCEVEIPDALIERQIDSMVSDMEYRMMYQGLKLEDYLKYTKQTMDDYRNIKAEQDEIDKKIADQAIAMGKDAEEYKKSLNERQIAYFENNVLIDKLFAFLTANNKVD